MVETIGYSFSNSAELYADCRSADPVVQNAAYKLLWHYLYRVALQVVHDQPEAEMLAEDCAQEALFRLHTRIDECREPHAFRIWARRIVSHVAIDELRRRKRLFSLDEDTLDDSEAPLSLSLETKPLSEAMALERIGLAELRRVIQQAPISDRSRRVILGRYLDDLPDETLAQSEGELIDQPVRPSHIQVTRAKNITKLRNWDQLQTFLK